MISVTELFKRNGVDCPYWLSEEMLNKDWLNSTYSIEEGVHRWTLQDDMRNIVISFDGEEYCFTAFDSSGEMLLVKNVITESSEWIS